MRDNFYPFAMERQMSLWDNQVSYNLSVSGVQPLSIRELSEYYPDFIDELISTGLGYPPTNGLIELRERIASLYQDCIRDNVVVTTGAAQANFTTVLTLLDPGDQLLVMLPNYMQIWGIGKNYDLDVRSFSLKERLGWGIDVEEFNQQVTGKTRIIAVCNPNNPTGYIMSLDEMDAIIRAADRVGAWILADEVYAGTEHNQKLVTPSFWGRYERVLAINSVSKAYALPGLRIGWVVAPDEVAQNIWARQDYITLSATMLANKIAAFALSPAVRPRLLARTLNYIHKGYAIFVKWCQDHHGLINLTPPRAAAIAFVRYNHAISSAKLVDHLIREQDTYVVPGELFGLDQYLRISFGMSENKLTEGLERIANTLRNLQQKNPSQLN